jgi:hypothetical protein
MRKTSKIVWGAALLAVASLLGADYAMARGGGGGGRGGGGRTGGTRGGSGNSGRLRRQGNQKKDPKKLEAERERMRQLDYRDADAPSDRGAL